jgi:hypothetical protein
MESFKDNERDSRIAGDAKLSSDAAEESEARLSGEQPDHDEIAILAYGIYVNRGGEHGNHLEDWLQAEREVAARKRAQTESSRPESNTTRSKATTA